MPDRKDRFYYLAKSRKYRSRAAFKLIELQQKFSIISEGDLVLDIGASPGSWSQVAHEFSGSTVIGVDLTRIVEENWMKFMKGDILSPLFPQKLEAFISGLGIRKFNCIISDAMSHTSGVHDRDHASSYLLCERVMEIASMFLDTGGNMVIKQFYGDLTAGFVQKWEEKFRFSKTTSVGATRKGSSEVYIIFKGLL